MQRDNRKDFEELARLVGDGKPGVGRERIAKMCGALQSAISNWKSNGIPPDHRVLIWNHLTKSNKSCPDWLLDVEVPIGNEVDALPLRQPKRVRVPA